MTTVRLCFAQTITKSQTNLGVQMMPIGFKQENALQIYGDGEGFIVIEEWETDECKDLLGMVKIHHNKFKDILELHGEDLLAEAFSGIKHE
jgi:hypothetical protein